MYRFDYSLIGRLPNLLRMNKGDVAKMLGTTTTSFSKWEKGDLPCESLVKICNTFRISLSHFLKVGSVPGRQGVASDYVIPANLWQPVEWHSEAAAKLFGSKGLTGISKQDAADKLGQASLSVFDRWATHSTSLRMGKLIEMLNEFQIDASLFFRDPNHPIPLPAWEVGNKHIAEIVAERMGKYRELERKNADKDETIRSLTVELERVKRENRSLRSKLGEGGQTTVRSGIASESAVAYKNPFGERGYVFHHALWEALPGMFEMTAIDFCKEIGLGISAFYNYQNVHTDVLLKACNLLRISVTHFFVPKSEPLVVQERTFYQMSPRVFVPIESRVERMKYLFGRYSAVGYTWEELQRLSGIGRDAFRSMYNGVGDKSRVLTLVDICTQFNIPPSIFFQDDNRKKPTYSQSVNERLMLNAISMEMEIEKLRAKLRDDKGKEK